MKDSEIKAELRYYSERYYANPFLDYFPMISDIKDS